MDYACEKGAKRNFEVWRQQPKGNGDDETEEERLERLEREEEERGAMENLEAKVLDAKREMEIADALDEIRTRNARNERARGKEVEVVEKDALEWERERMEREDEERAKKAFMTEGGERVRRIGDDGDIGEDGGAVGLGAETVGNRSALMMPPPPPPPPPPTFQRTVKKKKDFAAALGIKKKPTLV